MKRACRCRRKPVDAPTRCRWPISTRGSRTLRTDTLWPYFERLRKEEPVHYCTTSPVGEYWSVTKFNDIMHVETNPQIFSSDVHRGGIMLRDVDPKYEWPSFIAMDEPKHSAQRKSVQPLFSPQSLAQMAVLIRQRSASVLDNLPRNETFNWVEKVSIELTTQMLATLFDFPWEDRRKLTRWSDVATALPKSGIVESEETAPGRTQRLLRDLCPPLRRTRAEGAEVRPHLHARPQRRRRRRWIAPT